MSRLRAHRHRDAGFTLIELTVALVAGLMVVLGLMALSKEASRTFNEEVRSTAAEASLRTANDRLRADLSRAGFMSTGNINADPRVCLPIGTTFANLNPPPPLGIQTLQSIMLYEGGSLAATPLSAQQASGPNPNVNLAPDAILISGNMTTAEQLPILSMQPNGNCTRIMVSPVSPALYRVASSAETLANQALEFRHAFQPIDNYQFIVRLVDDTGFAQYLETCNETPSASIDASGAWVDIALDTKIFAPTDTQTRCGVGAHLGGSTATTGQSTGHSYINPVQTVRWELVAAAGTGEATNTKQYSGALGNLSSAYGTTDTTKYDLVRSYVDITNSKLLPIYASSEVVAEYAVDFDFAFTVDTGTSAAPSPQTFAFEDNADNDLYTTQVSANLATSRPQRLREIRYRLVTRSALGDRSVNVPVSSSTEGQYGSEQYLYRYCINPTSCAKSTADGTLCWARARTVTGEVTLPNLQTSYF